MQELKHCFRGNEENNLIRLISQGVWYWPGIADEFVDFDMQLLVQM